jgi:6-phosphogluconolactonase
MNRLTLTLCFASALYLLGCATSTQMSDSTSIQHFYLGTYSTKLGHVDGRAKGISYWSLDSETGALTKKGGPWPIVNASHLCTSRDGKFLYAISETDEYKGEEDGYITSYAIDSKTGGLTELGTISSEGVGPAYVSLDQSGRYLLLANYVAGNIVVYPRLRNGLLGEPTSNVQHTGSSINPERQEAPHPHSIIASPDNQFVLAADLGLDKIKVYGFDDKSGALEPLPTHDAITPAGSGPRHLVFHPSGNYVYLTLEMASQVAAYAFEAGKLTLVDIYSTLPLGVRTPSSNAEIRVTQDGRFLYASNRGHDSIAAFQINEATGELTLIHTLSTEGKTPRNFGIAPNDRLIVAGNQDSHTILSYKIDEETGRLTPTGKKAATPSPVLFHFE